MRKVIVGFVTLALLLSMIVSIGSFARAEVGEANGTIGNATPKISNQFSLTGGGITETDKDDGTYNLGSDAVIYPQFNDVLTIEGGIQDANGRESTLSLVTYDEIYSGANTVTISIYEDVDDGLGGGPDGDIDPTNDAAGLKWTFTPNLAAPDVNVVGGTLFDIEATATTGEVIFTDGDLTDISWPSSGLNYGVTPILHGVVITIEDNDGADLAPNAANTEYGTAGGDPALNSITNYYCLGFYTQQAYKVLGVYDEETNTWVDQWDYAAASNYLGWEFHTGTPDGDADETNQPLRSGLGTGSVAGTNDHLLAIQWLLPNTLSASLTLSMDQNFVTWDDAAGVLDTIPNNDGAGAGTTDFFYEVDGTGAAGSEITGDYNATYLPTTECDTDATGFTDGGAADGSFLNDGDTSIAVDGVGKTVGGLNQYDVVFFYYVIDLPSFTADGWYYCAFTVSVAL